MTYTWNIYKTLPDTGLPQRKSNQLTTIYLILIMKRQCRRPLKPLNYTNKISIVKQMSSLCPKRSYYKSNCQKYLIDSECHAFRKELSSIYYLPGSWLKGWIYLFVCLFTYFKGGICLKWLKLSKGNYINLYHIQSNLTL